jgi:hypothetical protein
MTAQLPKESRINPTMIPKTHRRILTPELVWGAGAATGVGDTPPGGGGLGGVVDMEFSSF